MPVNLVPNEAIPKLAAQVDAAGLKVLRHLRQFGFVLNGSDVDGETAAVLQRLVNLGLADPAYLGPADGLPFHWVSNSNGERVLWYLTGIRAGPHYEISSSELALWLERQGTDRWWSVDGDPLLTGRLSFPCPADELAAELRKLGRPLLVQAKPEDAGARGQVIDAAKLAEAVSRFTENLHASGPRPAWAEDRVLYLCWKGAYYEWLLAEDSETTNQVRADEDSRTHAAPKAN